MILEKALQIFNKIIAELPNYYTNDQKTGETCLNIPSPQDLYIF